LYISREGEATGVEWDERTARTNLRKHAVDLADATAVLEDERGVTIREELSPVNEIQFLTLGKDSLGRVLVVAHTWRPPNVRLTSARKATPAERRQYAEKGR
jgi:uncharacterized DUF497 family protein